MKTDIDLYLPEGYELTTGKPESTNMDSDKTHVIMRFAVKPIPEAESKKMGMQVDFNSARIQACHSYSRLVGRLNNYIDDDGEIRIDADKLDDYLTELHNDLVLIAATSMEGFDNFACVVDQIKMVDYNPEDY